VQTTTSPRPKQSRSVRRLAADAVRITCGRVTRDYPLREFPADEGRGFQVGEYNVFLHANGQDRLCDCLGFLQHGHCKHADGLAALLSR
jgi:hypothetical protein